MCGKLSRAVFPESERHGRLPPPDEETDGGPVAGLKTRVKSELATLRVTILLAPAHEGGVSPARSD